MGYVINFACYGLKGSSVHFVNEHECIRSNYLEQNVFNRA